MAQGKFATSVSCMDGRIQNPVTQWIKQNYQADFVDVITEPGVDKIISSQDNSDILERIKDKVAISINAHGSKLVVVSGHHDCAGNPVSAEKHILQIRQCVNTVSSWDMGIKVVGVWIDDLWHVNTV